MKTNEMNVSRVGDLVAAAFDSAARYSTDPEEVERLATGAVCMILQTGCRQAVVSALRTKKTMERIRLDRPKDKRIERKAGPLN